MGTFAARIDAARHRQAKTAHQNSIARKEVTMDRHTAYVNDRVAILKDLRATGPKVVGWEPGQVTPPAANSLVATGLAQFVEPDGTGLRKIEATPA